MKKIIYFLSFFLFVACSNSESANRQVSTNENTTNTNNTSVTDDNGICNTKPGKGFLKILDKRDGQEYSYHEFSTLSWMAEIVRLEGEGAYLSGKATQNRKEVMYTREAAEKACPEGWRLPTSQEFIDLLKCKGAHVEDINGKIRLDAPYDLIVQFAGYGRATEYLEETKDGLKLPRASTEKTLKNYWVSDMKNGQPMGVNFFIPTDKEKAMAWVAPISAGELKNPVKYCRCVKNN